MLKRSSVCGSNNNPWFSTPDIFKRLRQIKRMRSVTSFTMLLTTRSDLRVQLRGSFSMPEWPARRFPDPSCIPRLVRDKEKLQEVLVGYKWKYATFATTFDYKFAARERLIFSPIWNRQIKTATRFICNITNFVVRMTRVKSRTHVYCIFLSLEQTEEVTNLSTDPSTCKAFFAFSLSQSIAKCTRTDRYYAWKVCLSNITVYQTA